MRLPISGPLWLRATRHLCTLGLLLLLHLPLLLLDLRRRRAAHHHDGAGPLALGAGRLPILPPRRVGLRASAAVPLHGGNLLLARALVGVGRLFRHLLLNLGRHCAAARQGGAGARPLGARRLGLLPLRPARRRAGAAVVLQVGDHALRTLAAAARLELLLPTKRLVILLLLLLLLNELRCRPARCAAARYSRARPLALGARQLPALPLCPSPRLASLALQLHAWGLLKLLLLFLLSAAPARLRGSSPPAGASSQDRGRGCCALAGPTLGLGGGRLPTWKGGGGCWGG
mmetsp:Transcript_104543/g.305212  ORF Transcript_104543/g.305212 Transcript_104543/m.305212 type:complete len:288 (-) Transcript_104543:3919-4782(-)